MKLFFQAIAFIAVLVALVWAKKTFLDAPKQQEPVVAFSSTPKPVTLGNDGAPARAPQSEPPVPTEPDPQAAQKGEDNAISNLLHKFTGGAKPEDRARVRIKAFMQAWKEGGNSLSDAEQAAACLYSRGKLIIPDRQEVEDAYNGFVAFRKAKNLYSTPITDYSIGDASPAHDEAHGDYTAFEVNINNFPYGIGVPDKPNPIFWTR